MLDLARACAGAAVTDRLLPDCLTARTVLGVTTTLGTASTARGSTANIAAHGAATHSLGAASAQQQPNHCLFVTRDLPTLRPIQAHESA